MLRARIGSVTQALNAGSEYTDEQRVFLMAIDAYRRKTRKIVSLEEGFAVAIALGYRRVAKPYALPVVPDA